MEEKIRELVTKICREALDDFGNLETTYDYYLRDFELGHWLVENANYRTLCELLNIKESED